MKQIHLFIATLLLPGNASFATGARDAGDIDSNLKAQVGQWIQSQPVRFSENKGQMTDTEGNPVPFVLFKADVSGMNIYITEKGITYLFIKPEEEKHVKEREESPLSFGEGQGGEVEWQRIDMDLQGAQIKKENIIKEIPSFADFNFFLSHCPHGIYGVKEYEKITIKEVYPGIDWVLYGGTNQGMKYDFVVHPGADPGQIKLQYMGSGSLIVTEDGQLNSAGNNSNGVKITSNLGTINEGSIFCYESTSAGQKTIAANYQLVSAFAPVRDDRERERILQENHPAHIISFHLNDYNPAETLVIDPPLVWASLYGGSGVDGFCSIADDNSGNIFITGYTGSANFPLQNVGGFYQGAYAGSVDALLLKFSNNGTLLWATYYGGSEADVGNSIVTDAAGNVFVTGDTRSPNFPLQNAGSFYQGTYGGDDDIFILKFDNAGSLIWATYYGGLKADVGVSIATDATGNVFVTGLTRSSNFPLQNSGGFYQGTFGGSTDIFILKFTNSGGLLWATYYGGLGNDWGNSISTDAAGNVFVTGLTRSSNFPLQNSVGFYQGILGGSADVFILKFTNAGGLLWATYYGGLGDDSGISIATDTGGNVFVTGWTGSTDFPLQNAGTFYQGIYGGGQDAFILKFDNTGNRIWATYYGGSDVESCVLERDIAIDACGNVYVSFHTSSTDITTRNSCDAGGYYDASFNGSRDQFLTLFSNAGDLIWATYMGGNKDDFRNAMTVDANNNLFITGEWGNGTGSPSSGTYPFINPGGVSYYDGSFNGSDDSFIAKFCGVPCICGSGSCTVGIQVTISSVNVLCNGECTGSAAAVTSGGSSPYTYQWSSGQTTQTITGLCVGNYTITVTDSTSGISTATITITQPTVLTVTATSTQSSCGSNNGSATATAGGGTSGYTYSWNNSQTLQIVTGLAAGNYTVTITDANGCTATQTVTVVSSGSITTSQSASICSGASYTLPGGTVVSTGGTYNDTLASVAGCDSIIATTLTVNPNPTAGAFSNVTITQGQSTTLTAIGGGTYQWSPAAGLNCVTCANPVLTASPLWGAGGLIYCVTVTDANNCTDTACVTVSIEQIDCSLAGDLYLPNAFSPNGDGENDKLKIYYGNPICIKTFKLVIYNRWGENVFETTNPLSSWDGSYKGKIMDTSVLVYYMKATMLYGKEIIKKENISLLR